MPVLWMMEDTTCRLCLQPVCVPEVFAQRRWVVGQKRVDQAKQLHDSLVLPQVLVALQQEHELMAVASCRGSHSILY